MLRKQHKVDEYHNDMPLIYYVEGHSLHFGRPEFALITGMRFGIIRFCSYTSADLKFHNRVFPHKVGLVVTILDVLGVIEDEVMFGNLCDEDSVCRCLILALEVIFMGRLFTCPVDDSLFGLVKNLEAWNVFSWGEHVWTQLYDSIKNVVVRHSDTHSLGFKKDCNYVPTYTLTGFVFTFQIWNLESFERSNLRWINAHQVIPRAIGWSKKSIFKRSDCCYLFAKLEKSRKRLASSFRESSSVCTRDSRLKTRRLTDRVIRELNVRVFKLETIIQVLALQRNDKLGRLQFNDDLSILRELKLCLEEERIRSEQEKRIQQEKRLRLEEEKMLRLEEEKMNDAHYVTCKAKPKESWVKIKKYCQNDVSRLFHSMDTIWLSDDIERFISQPGQLKSMFPWSDDYTHIDLWVDYMWHGRRENVNWAMVSCYFVQLLRQNSMPLYYANGDKYGIP
ncbi:hypothetical protein Tco_1153838 [Tanacetum coccineum]